jgi:predicted DCC family thiol-disulfide oxidoreductase YuxK
MGHTDFDIAALYDGGCPSCSRQVERLREWDTRGLIRFTDVSAPGFDADRDAGIPVERTTDCLQVRMESGEVLAGSDALRYLNQIAGLARQLELTRLPGFARFITVAYRTLAENGRRRGERRTLGANRGARDSPRAAGGEARIAEDSLACPKASRPGPRGLGSAEQESSRASRE